MPPKSVDPLRSFTGSRLVVVAGKGGVGKTTVTASLARAAADLGRKVLVVDVEGRPGLAALLGSDAVLGYDDIELLRTPAGGSVWGRVIEPGAALTDYLHNAGLKRLSKRLARSGVVDVVATAAPGIDDLLVLGKIKQIERSGAYDLVVVDGPAAGHAVTFLQAPAGLADAVTAGPIASQAADVLAMLADPARCQVVLVTLPETTPVNELVETAYTLEDRVGVQLGPVVVNAVDAGGRVPDPDTGGRVPDPDTGGRVPDPDTGGRVPDPDTVRLPGGAAGRALRAAALFRRARIARHREAIERLHAELPLPTVELPWLPCGEVGAAEVQVLAAALTAGPSGVPS
jgi:Mrp family chromosome partitioning ATPase